MKIQVIRKAWTKESKSKPLTTRHNFPKRKSSL